jgi:hypothetical protein
LPNGYTHIPKKRKRGNTSHCQIGCNHLAMWCFPSFSFLSCVGVTIWQGDAFPLFRFSFIWV